MATLLSDIDQVKDVLPVAVASTFDNVKGFIEQAELRFIMPELSNDVMSTLRAYNGSDVDILEAIRQLRSAIAYYAYLLYVPVNQLKISDTGIHIITNDQIKTAFGWQIDNLEVGLKNAADERLEYALAFMESKKAKFPDWVASYGYTRLKEAVVSSADQFNNLTSMRLYRSQFRKLNQPFKNIQRKTITPVTGKALFDELMSEYQSGTLSANNLKLMEFIQPAVAYLGLSLAVPTLTVSISDLGITTGTNNIMKETRREPGDEFTIKSLIAALQEAGMDYVAQLSAFLFENHADYPLYEESAAYNPTEASSFKNKICNGIYVV